MVGRYSVRSMKTQAISLVGLVLALSARGITAGETSGILGNSALEITGGYSPTRTNGHAMFVDPSEFWISSWKEGANGWRAQLRVYGQTDYILHGKETYPVSTNLMLSVEWGSPAKNSGGGYFLAPNGKFAKFELVDAKGNVVPPNPRAGINAINKWGIGVLRAGHGLTYGGELAAWLSLQSGSLVADFPERISPQAYPRFADTGQIVGAIWTATNRPPACIGLLNLEDIYFVNKEADYTLTVQPVLYKQSNKEGITTLDRVDLPVLTTKIHLSPTVRQTGGYSLKRETDGRWTFLDPSEFWRGAWKEAANGWRVQLRILPGGADWVSQTEEKRVVRTNPVLSVEWGSPAKNSGDGYFMSPNGKFAQFQLADPKGNVIPPSPRFGTNLLECFVARLKAGSNFIEPPYLAYGPSLPAWVAPAGGSLVAQFPQRIATNAYPRFKHNGRMAGETAAVTNRPPSVIGLIALDDLYSVTYEADYTLTVQPVLYRMHYDGGTFQGYLDRVDLSSVTTKVHLVPVEK
jgi:hypothetical protein